MLKKLSLKPGVNREGTRYSSEGGWYSCDKVRFRSGQPEKIGGWERISTDTYLGVCRSMWNWTTNGGLNVLSVGTNIKYYVEAGGVYNDITPIRSSVTLNGPFDTTDTLTTVVVNDVAHGATTGSYVTFSGASAVGGLTLNGEFEITVIDADSYSIESATPATSTATGGGGATVATAYPLNIGASSEVPTAGWGAAGWGGGYWGEGDTGTTTIRIWSQSNFGEDLVFCYKGSPLYYWDASSGVGTRGVLVSSLGGAADVPDQANAVLVSAVSRFVFAFGTEEFSTTVINPMLVRWSDIESAAVWTQSATSQAGEMQLSHGSEIITAMQARQEVLVWTDTALFSMQYVGPPLVWGATLVGDNISIISGNAVALGSGVAYWMGTDKFYKYDGRVQTLRCDLRQHIFGDINLNQTAQIFCGTNEGFNEVWWFYCSADSDTIDSYAIYNYLEDIWYYGAMARTAWLDSSLREAPLAATYINNVVFQEKGVDDKSTGEAAAIEAHITSSEFDLDDGHNFMFVWRVLPDMTFRGSTADSPSATMYLLPLKNSGSGYTDPESVGGSDNAAITRTATVPIEAYTGQVFIRVRGRQMAMKVLSSAVGVTWQLGSPRLDMRQDGRR